MIALRPTRRAALALLFGVAAAPLAAARQAAARPLFDFAIAGGPYHGLGRALRAGLGPGAVLTLAREPENPHDANAVAVHGADGARLGYVPRRAAAELAPLLDAGAEAEAVVLAMTGETPPAPGVRMTTWLPGDPVLRLRLFG